MFGNTYKNTPVYPELNSSRLAEQEILDFNARNGYGFVDGQYIYLIGGRTGTEAYKKYINLINTNLHLIEPMPQRHSEGAGLLMRNKDFWIFGGIDASGQVTNTSHYIRNEIWYDGPTLQHNIYGMCVVNFMDKYAIMIGGKNEQGNLMFFPQCNWQGKLCKN